MVCSWVYEHPLGAGAGKTQAQCVLRGSWWRWALVWGGGRTPATMLEFKVSGEVGVKLAPTGISRAGWLFLSCSSRVSDQEPLVFLCCYLTLKTPAVILHTIIGMDHMKF